MRLHVVSDPPSGDWGAAVLAPVWEETGEWFTVFVKRPETAPTHAGDLAFPGGRREPGESMVETATREANEELGLRNPEVLGYLPSIDTIQFKRRVVPVIGSFPARPELVPDPREVARPVVASLTKLSDESQWRWETWRNHRVWFADEVDGEVLWGATAAMTRILLGLPVGNEPQP